MDVVEWSRALDVRLSEWCCSVTMVWVQIPSREEQKFDSSNSNTVWFNFQTYISNSNTVWFNFQTYIYGLIFRRIKYIYIRLKIKPNSIRIRFFFAVKFLHGIGVMTCSMKICYLSSVHCMTQVSKCYP